MTRRPLPPGWSRSARSWKGGPAPCPAWASPRAALVKDLESHEGDSYYLGTPYVGGDHQSPNGDASYNGRPSMNCGGFVSYVLRKAGLRADEAMRLIKLIPGQSNLFGSGLPYDLLAGASNYRNLVKNAGLEAYVYGSAESLLASGQAERGDIIFIDKGPGAKAGDDTHIGFYWGPSADRAMWHSNQPSNKIGPITALTADPIFILIKIE